MPIEATQHDLSTHLRDGLCLVCLTSTEFLRNMKSERASRRFHHAFQESRLPGLKLIRVDFAKMLPPNVNLMGISMWKTLPVVILFKDGFELARKTILVGEASNPECADRLREWVRGLEG